MKITEKLIVSFLIITVVIGIYFFYTNKDFYAYLVQEDGFFENLTSIFLFLSSFYLFYFFISNIKLKSIWWKMGIIIMIIGLFFGAGEEISWGQRIFHIESSKFFNENNSQKETNLHNMIVDGVKLNKLIFSNLLSIIFSIYFLILPILWRKNNFIKKTINQFGIPIANNYQVIIFMISSLIIILSISNERKWEIWEYTFALTMFLIVLNPLNKKEIIE
ncbi:hypothetical protein [Epilithonimonas vandammei]|jgi:hypothetical protein|uniref:hypothetical protein n=1 Tax=Epilithonimonas vandammei TaxID=2487072 RepID=UPI00289B60D5|nr:hypothetical protein [Epilithonimonas vandammei]